MKIQKEGWGGLVRSAGLALACAAMAACSTLGGGGSVSVIGQAKRTVGLGHDAHAAAANALAAAVGTGLLHGSAAATAKQYLDESETYLTAADTAIAAGDAASALSDANSATPLIAKAQAAASQK